MSASSKYYPIAVNLSEKPVLVIGGGRVAERKVRTLLGTGSFIRVVSPSATPGLRRLAGQNAIKWIPRALCKKDISGREIIIAATDNKSINRKASRWAGEHRTWINVVDEKALSSFISPAVFRAKKGIITVYTGGRDPELSRDLKNFLKENWDGFVSYRSGL